jgi:hypothetical protein
MSIFSFNWFKKNKPKDETPAVVITTSTESTAPTLQYVEKYNPLPYSSLKIVNDVITVVLNNGNVISKTDAKMEDYEAIKTCTTEADIIKYVMKSNSVNEPVYVEHVVVTAKDIESTSGAETSNLPLLSMLDIKFVTTGVSNKVPETTDILLIELLASLTPSLGPVKPLIILVNTLTLLEK